MTTKLHGYMVLCHRIISSKSGLFIQPDTLLPKLPTFYDANSVIGTVLFFITKTLEHLYSYGPSTTYCFLIVSLSSMDCTFPFASFLAGTCFINPAPQCKLLNLNEPRLNVFFACTARFMQTHRQIQNSSHNLPYILLTKIS